MNYISIGGNQRSSARRALEFMPVKITAGCAALSRFALKIRHLASKIHVEKSGTGFATYRGTSVVTKRDGLTVCKTCDALGGITYILENLKSTFVASRGNLK